MPLVLMCGLPCSGKSSAAAALVELFQNAGADAVIIDETSLHLDRIGAYCDSASEKRTRGALKAATDRALTKGRVVIVDSLNYIKGYRYELWCIARALATRYAVLHCNAPQQQCRDWNAERAASGEPAYDQHILDGLIDRFERPEGRNRWDAPLFTVEAPHNEGRQATLQALVTAITAATSRHQQLRAGHDLQPTCATSNPAPRSTNLLSEVDRAAQTLVDAVMEGQTAAAGGAAGRVQVGEGEDAVILELPRAAPLPELRRHKRAFLKLTTQHSGSQLSDARSARRMFAEYLTDHVT